MGCNGCTPLTGDRVKLVTNVAITSTGGFSGTEIMRLTVPPSAEPLFLEADLAVGATTGAGTTSNVIAWIAAVAAPTALSALNVRAIRNAHSLTDLANGVPLRIRAEPTLPGESFPPGDYAVYAQRGANAASVIGSAIQPSLFWWER